MPETLTETFARFAEDAEFRRWNEGRKPESRFVYVFQDASVWNLRWKDGGDSSPEPSATVEHTIFPLRTSLRVTLKRRLTWIIVTVVPVTCF